MKLELYQISAFTDNLFGGNSACVVPLKSWLPDEMLLSIAKENAVAETAFFIPRGDAFHLRWFTPKIEMDLCGHATLATAHCLIEILKHPNHTVSFETLSGQLTVTRIGNYYQLDFPARPPEITNLPTIVSLAINLQPIEVLRSRDYLLVYDSEQDIRNIKIERQTFDQINLDPGGVIVTAPGNHCDFVSRYFTPQASILEDPVTGSAHCTLIPFWSERLSKKKLIAQQLSERLGHLLCEDCGDRVLISGMARTYSTGHIWMTQPFPRAFRTST